MSERASATLTTFGQEFGLALHGELGRISPAPGGWARVRVRVLPAERGRGRRGPRPSLVLVAAIAVLAAGGLVAAAATAERTLTFGRRPAHPAPVATQPAVPAEIASLQARSGFHVLTETGNPSAELLAAEALPAIAGATPGVRLTYAYGGGTAVVGEFRSTSAGGSTILRGDRSQVVETVTGRQLLFTYDSTGDVTSVLWSTSEVTVAVGFAPAGVTHEQAVAFVEHLR